MSHINSANTKVLEVIANRLKEENRLYSYLDGKTSAEDRIKLVEDFNNNDIDEIINYVELKYPNWYNNEIIEQLSDLDKLYLNYLSIRDYNKIKEYLSKF